MIVLELGDCQKGQENVVSSHLVILHLVLATMISIVSYRMVNSWYCLDVRLVIQVLMVDRILLVSCNFKIDRIATKEMVLVTEFKRVQTTISSLNPT